MRLKNRLGEEKHNDQGCLMKIVEYNNAHDMTVEFQDEHKYRKKALLSNWTKGSISNPFFPHICGKGYLGVEKGEEKNNKFYNIWYNMLKRCYNEKNRERAKSYKDCVVCDEWHNFQNFKQWCIENYYEIQDVKMHLDKDILIRNNKIYSPYTCCFVPADINKLFVGINNDLCGVSWDKHRSKWSSTCNQNGILQHLGRFDNLAEALLAYNHFKENLIQEKAKLYEVYLPNYVYNALINYKIKFQVYSVVEYGGAYGDSYSHVVKTYTSKIKAEAKMNECQQAEAELVERGRRCNGCPFVDEPYARLENLMLNYPNYCPNAQLRSDEDKRIDCENWCSHWDATYFRIEVVEVEE